MNALKVLARSLLLSLAATTMAGAAATASDAKFSAVLAYPPDSPTPATSGVFRSHGKAYRFRLYPERSAYTDALSNFTLAMEAADSPGRGNNLFEPTGNWHGYQKFFFAASDFEHGAARSSYGNPRTIELPRLGVAVQITIVRVAVGPASATAAVPEFKDLTLKIVARPSS
jgi:hypothetical protein